MPAVGHRIRARLAELMGEDLSLPQLAEMISIDEVNLRKLKNGHVRSIRFSTLTALCDALQCTPGDLLSLVPEEEEVTAGT